MIPFRQSVWVPSLMQEWMTRPTPYTKTASQRPSLPRSLMLRSPLWTTDLRRNSLKAASLFLLLKAPLRYSITTFRQLRLKIFSFSLTLSTTQTLFKTHKLFLIHILAPMRPLHIIQLRLLFTKTALRTLLFMTLPEPICLRSLMMLRLPLSPRHPMTMTV